MSCTRLVTISDAEVLADLLSRNREFLAPWEPTRPEDYFTAPGQRARIGRLLDDHDQGRAVPHLITDKAGSVVGAITLGRIERRAFRSGGLGYWVAAEHNGRGLATAAVGEITRLAFTDQGLHRVEAGTLLHNGGSQRVLLRNGFVRFGTAPGYLEIAGRWQDHVLFQRLADPAPGEPASPGLGVATVAVLVREYDEAIAFYAGVLGLRVLVDQPTGATRFVVLGGDGPGAELHLARAETVEQRDLVGRQAGGRVAFFLRTTDFPAQHRRMFGAGVVFHEQPRHEPYGTVAVFSDLYGNPWDLIQPH